MRETSPSPNIQVHGWAIPQDNRIVHQIRSSKKYPQNCFNLPNNAYVMF